MTRHNNDHDKTDPSNAATDPHAAAQQEQIHADRDALVDSARRVDASVRQNDEPATDPKAAAVQERVKRDHDRLEESSRRVEASVSETVRETPVEPSRNREH